ncbi:methionyl-tRNA formyltransferase [Thermodesulfobacteriota bacterium]
MSQSHSDLFPENPNIIFMGTPDFSVPPLKALMKEGYNITAVVTQPDRQRGRGKKISFSPVKEAALDNKLKVVQRENINDKEFIDELRSYKPDIFIVSAFGQILNPELISVPGYGAVNIHASLLPKYRGAAPIQWAILNNDPVTGITIMKMARGLDAGPILMKEEVPIGENETSGQLIDRLSDLSGDVIVKFLKNSAGKTVKEEPQEDSKVSYTPKITKEMALINWEAEARKVSSHIRAMDPAPGASTLLGDKKIKLFSPKVLDNLSSSDTPGKVIIDEDNRFIVETDRGRIEIGEIQLPGKKRMAIKDYLRGNSIKPDTVLGR